MSTRFAAALTLATLVAAPALAGPLSECELLNHRLTGVKEHKVQEQHGKLTIDRVDGASVYVAAEPGLTAQWLERTLEHHVAAMRDSSMDGCPLAVEGISVSVSPASKGFWVTIHARDAQHGKLVAERAESLVKSAL
jgi:hypothetical protein